MTASADPSGDTIVAIATPPGTGALAIVRLSGPTALAVADGAFQGRRPLREAATHTAHYGRIVQPPALFRPGGDEVAGAGEVRGAGRHETPTGDAGQPEPPSARVTGPMCTTGSGAPAVADGTLPEPAPAGGLEVVDDVVATVFREPASYTGEDTVEITCHGSNLVAATVVAALLHHGARAAEPGEFTRRAFLNGKLDLTQAEAVGRGDSVRHRGRPARRPQPAQRRARRAGDGVAAAVAGVRGARRAGVGLLGGGRGAGAGGRDRRARDRGAHRHRRDAGDLPHRAHAPRRRARGAGRAAQRGQVVAAEPAGAGIAGAGHRHSGHHPRRDPRGPRHPRRAGAVTRHRRSASHRRDRGAAGRGAQHRHRRRRRPGAVRDRRRRAVSPCRSGAVARRCRRRCTLYHGNGIPAPRTWW